MGLNISAAPSAGPLSVTNTNLTREPCPRRFDKQSKPPVREMTCNLPGCSDHLRIEGLRECCCEPCSCGAPIASSVGGGIPYAKPSILQCGRRAGGYEGTSRREITVAPHSDPDYSEVGISSGGMNKESSEFVRRRGPRTLRRFEGRRRGEGASGSGDLL